MSELSYSAGFAAQLAQQSPFITKINAHPKIFAFGSEDDLRRIAHGTGYAQRQFEISEE